MSQWNPEWQVSDLERLIRNYNEKVAAGESKKTLDKNSVRIEFRVNEIRKRPQSKQANAQCDVLMKDFRAQQSLR